MLNSKVHGFQSLVQIDQSLLLPQRNSSVLCLLSSRLQYICESTLLNNSPTHTIIPSFKWMHNICVVFSVELCPSVFAVVTFYLSKLDL